MAELAMTFAEWQRSRGILPWTAVHRFRGSPAGLRMLRAGARFVHRAQQIADGWRALDRAAAEAARSFQSFGLAFDATDLPVRVEELEAMWE
jgi:hypothetical protein